MAEEQLSPEHWQRIKELLDDALEVAPTAQAAWLAQACTGDEELQREVGNYLAFQSTGAAFMENPACSLLAREADAVSPGQRVGPYRVLRRIARGGVGAVYLAVREDPFVKKVAIKLLRPGMNIREIIRRFEQERQILAQLEHPGIARLLDGGSTDDGRSYFVMEHVVGEPIDRYCQRRQLAVNARLELFLRVGSAVAFAHRRGVVHRDLKPGNILVTPEGEPKLLDFGIAEILDPQSFASTALGSGDAVRPMTPSYASPEQLRGEGVTPASDVFSLGVLLWELLTDRRLRLTTTLDGREARPGSGAAGTRRLRGDLDAIVRRAQAQEPGHRYASAAELSTDLERHLAALPVHARQATPAYRAGRFLQRHRGLLGALLFCGLLALGFAAYVHKLSAELTDSLAVNREMAHALTAIAAALDSESSEKDPPLDEDLDHSVAEISRRLDAHPRLEADLLESMAAVSRSLERYSGEFRGVVIGSVDEGSVLEKAGVEPGDVVLSWRRPSAGNREPAGGELRTSFDWEWLLMEQAPLGPIELVGKDTTWTVGLGHWEAEVRPGLSQERQALYLEGREFLQAEDFERAVDRWRALEAQFTEHEGDLRSWILQEIGDAAHRARRPQMAEETYRAALEAAREGVARVVLLRTLGLHAEHRSDFEAAEAHYRSARHLLLEIAPDSLAMAECLNDLGAVAWNRGDLELTADHFRRALEIRERLAPESLVVAASLNNLGIVARIRGDLEVAATCYQRAFEIKEKLEPGSLGVANSLNNLGNVAWSRGEIALAAAYHQRALKIREQRAPDSLEVAESLNNLGAVAWSRGEINLAATYHQRALEIYERLAPESPRVAASLLNLGTVAEQRGEPGLATTLYLQALEIYEKLSPGSLNVADSLLNLGTVAEQSGDSELAAQYHQRALDIYEELAPEGLLAALASNNLGQVALARGDMESAATHLHRALEITQTLAPGSWFEAEALKALGELHAGREPLLAVRFFDRSIEALESQIGKLGGSHETRGRFRARRNSVYHDAITLRLKLGNAAQAFHLVERSRAQSFLALLAGRDLTLAPKLHVELDRQRRRIGAEYDRILKRLESLSPRRDAAEISKIQEELTLLRARQEALRARIQEASPRLAAVRYPRALTWEEARDVLDPGTAMLSYSVGREQTHLFLVRPGTDLHTATVPRGEEELRSRVRGFRESIANSLSQSALVKVAHRRLQEHGSRLYEVLIGPVENELADSERILFVPDGPLHLLPFSALGRLTGERFHYLVEWKPIHSVLSATVYAELKGRHAQHHEERSLRLAAFGDPVYPTTTITQEAGAGTADLLMRSAVERGYFGSWARLPSTRREIEGIAALFPAGTAEVFLGEAATEEQVKALGERQPHMVHFASHSFLDSRSPLDSGLVLTIPEGLPENRDNGLLQVWEILESVRFEADLVVLSACETGSGELRGGEGLIGLTRAFQVAGARSVVATLWSVADGVSAELMIRFYRHLRSGLPKDEALRAAQLELIRGPIRFEGAGGEVVERDASAPYFWAAFELLGDRR